MHWESIARLRLEIYAVGKRPRGRTAYCLLLPFKMLLVGQWHKLSDRELNYAYMSRFLRGIFVV